MGPFNLSLAALLDPIEGIRSIFLERQPRFEWHPGMLLPDTLVQTHYVKDLVTLADPRSPYSFLSFLFAKKRLYRFLVASFPRVSRLEFTQYFRWVCEQLENVQFGRAIERIDFDGDRFVIATSGAPDERTLTASNLVVGVGRRPHVPAFAAPHLGDTVFHVTSMLDRKLDDPGRVAVVGGGQSGAEAFCHLIRRRSGAAGRPREISWITRRLNFLPMDDSAFTNEWFMPPYVSHFTDLAPDRRRALLIEQQLASDGISNDLIQQIYTELYALEFLHGEGRFWTLLPHHEVTALRRGAGAWLLEVRDGDKDQLRTIEADTVIFCTGFESRFPDFLEPLRGRIRMLEDGVAVLPDFSIEADLPPDRRIFVQNAGRHSHGIAESNLSLAAWRSATIINSLLGRRVYDIEDALGTIDWAGAATDPERVAVGELPGDAPMHDENGAA